MTRAGDPDDLGAPLGYSTGDGRVPKLVVVAIVWAVFGLGGLFAALLLHSAGFAVFGVLCVLAGGGLYLAQRTREQLAYDESHPEEEPLTPEDPDLAEEAVEEHRAAEQETRMYAPYDPDDDILDAEFTEYFDYEPAPADQDDGTGYDDEDVAYQRFRDDKRAREGDRSADDRDDEAGDEVGDDEVGDHDSDDHGRHDQDAHDDHGRDDPDARDDEQRTSRIPTGGGRREHEAEHQTSDGRR